MRLLKFFFIFALIITKPSINAQESQGGKPLTFNAKYLQLYKDYNKSDKIIVNNYDLPFINNKEEKFYSDNIAKDCEYCKKKYYGKGIDVDVDIIKNGTLKILGDSSKLWLYKITSSSAYALQFYFDNFKLPKGARLFFYNEDHSMLLGAFTNNSNRDDIKFGTQYIKGNIIFIEYYEPYNSEFFGTIHLFRIIHCFIDVFEKKGPFSNNGSANCNINISCPLGEGWQLESKSVAIILYYDWEDKLAGFCSGALLNNAKLDGTPYFLTANHCVEGYIKYFQCSYDEAVSDWVFLFNHFDSYCSGDGSGVSSFPTQSAYGAILLSKDHEGSLNSDYLLLKLNVNPQTLKSYNVCYSGWDKREVNGLNSSFTVSIHHPAGDVKKISKDDNYPCSSGYPMDCNLGKNYWQVVWDYGVTEGGSSGSPLFNSNHKIIGQLRGGNEPVCESYNNRDYYGKFSDSWNLGFFDNWLDPNHTGISSVNTFCSSDPDSYVNGNGNGNSCENTYWIKDGFFLNNQFNKNIIICPDDRVVINLVEINSNSCIYLPIKMIKIPCKDDPGCGWLGQLLGTCDCVAIGMIFTVTLYYECDNEYNCKKNTGKVIIKKGYPDYVDVEKELSFNFEKGKYYKIKLNANYACGFPYEHCGYEESIKNIFISPDENININSDILFHLPKPYVSYSYDETYKASNTISISNVTVPEGSNLKMIAGEVINIGSETNINNNFNAYIQDFPQCIKLKSLVEDTINSYDITENSPYIIKKHITMSNGNNFYEPPLPVPIKNINNINNETFKILPNPADLESVIYFTLYNDCIVNLSIVNIYGDEKKLIINNIFQRKGQYKITTEISSLNSGIYFYKFKANNQIYLKKLIVLH